MKSHVVNNLTLLSAPFTGLALVLGRRRGDLFTKQARFQTQIQANLRRHGMATYPAPENRNSPADPAIDAPSFRRFQFVFRIPLDYSKKEPARREEPLFTRRGG